MAMQNLSPCPNCPLQCAHHDGPMCVSNLIHLAGENAPITLGLHIGLNHAYAGDGIPPCVHGPLGSAYWSITGNTEPPRSDHE